MLFPKGTSHNNATWQKGHAMQSKGQIIYDINFLHTKPGLLRLILCLLVLTVWNYIQCSSHQLLQRVLSGSGCLVQRDRKKLHEQLLWCQSLPGTGQFDKLCAFWWWQFVSTINYCRGYWMEMDTWWSDIIKSSQIHTNLLPTLN